MKKSLYLVLFMALNGIAEKAWADCKAYENPYSQKRIQTEGKSKPLTEKEESILLKCVKDFKSKTETSRNPEVYTKFKNILSHALYSGSERLANDAKKAVNPVPRLNLGNVNQTQPKVLSDLIEEGVKSDQPESVGRAIKLSPRNDVNSYQRMMTALNHSDVKTRSAARRAVFEADEYERLKKHLLSEIEDPKKEAKLNETIQTLNYLEFIAGSPFDKYKEALKDGVSINETDKKVPDTITAGALSNWVKYGNLSDPEFLGLLELAFFQNGSPTISAQALDRIKKHGNDHFLTALTKGAIHEDVATRQKTFQILKELKDRQLAAGVFEVALSDIRPEVSKKAREFVDSKLSNSQKLLLKEKKKSQDAVAVASQSDVQHKEEEKKSCEDYSDVVKKNRNLTENEIKNIHNCIEQAQDSAEQMKLFKAILLMPEDPHDLNSKVRKKLRNMSGPHTTLFINELALSGSSKERGIGFEILKNQNSDSTIGIWLAALHDKRPDVWKDAVKQIRASATFETIGGDAKGTKSKVRKPSDLETSLVEKLNEDIKEPEHPEPSRHLTDYVEDSSLSAQAKMSTFRAGLLDLERLEKNKFHTEDRIALSRIQDSEKRFKARAAIVAREKEVFQSRIKELRKVLSDLKTGENSALVANLSNELERLATMDPGESRDEVLNTILKSTEGYKEQEKKVESSKISSLEMGIRKETKAKEAAFEALRRLEYIDQKLWSAFSKKENSAELNAAVETLDLLVTLLNKANIKKEEIRRLHERSKQGQKYLTPEMLDLIGELRSESQNKTLPSEDAGAAHRRSKSGSAQ